MNESEKSNNNKKQGFNQLLFLFEGRLTVILKGKAARSKGRGQHFIMTLRKSMGLRMASLVRHHGT